MSLVGLAKFGEVRGAVGVGAHPELGVGLIFFDAGGISSISILGSGGRAQELGHNTLAALLAPRVLLALAIKSNHFFTSSIDCSLVLQLQLCVSWLGLDELVSAT
jgi:hypothetical protein